MTKEERIERYGIEAYERQLALGRKRASEWRTKNADREAENKKRYYALHKEEKSAYDKKYREENKEKRRLQNKIYRENNKEEINAKKKIYYNKIFKTKIGRASLLVSSYNRYDKLKGYDTSSNVSADWIVDNIFSGQRCIYCGEDNWERLGCDRIDNSKPHIAENIVCACGLCNLERADNHTVEEFKQYRSLHPRACDTITVIKPILKNGALVKQNLHIS